jgi:ERF superfamily protein
MSNTQLATIQEQPSVAIMLQGVLSSIQSGQTTPEHVEVLKGMMDLYERNEKRESEKQFAAALVKLQDAVGGIQATKAVKGNDGTERYKFAPIEDIQRQIKPHLTANGFNITFNTSTSENKLTAFCILTHESGFSRTNEFQVRYSKPPGSSDAQGDMSTKSYAKRGALCDALNITIEHDTDGDDGRALGKPITQEQADFLRKGVKLTGSDERKFLAYAKAATYEEIGEPMYDELCAILNKRAEKTAA